ncbi:MAG: hypothetical protein R3C61_12535 [Bacteroidia bacterium]
MPKDSEAEAQTAPEEKRKTSLDIFPEREQGRVKAVFAFNQGGDYQRSRTYPVSAEADVRHRQSWLPLHLILAIPQAN